MTADLPAVVPVVYVAGPYRAATPRRVLANIWRAQEAALAIWCMGGVAICPHSNCFLFDGEAPDDVWLKGDLELLRRSDALLLSEGWEASGGAQAEKTLAEALGLPVFYHDALHQLRVWITDWTHARA